MLTPRPHHHALQMADVQHKGNRRKQPLQKVPSAADQLAHARNACRWTHPYTRAVGDPVTLELPENRREAHESALSTVRVSGRHKGAEGERVKRQH